MRARPEAIQPPERPLRPAAVTLLGTGALATLYGARLARSGCVVTLVGTWPAALAAIRAEGLAVTEGGATWRAPARAVARADADGLAPAALVLVLVKSGATAEVAPLAARLVRPDGLILTLQNGLGHAETLAAAAGAARVAQGVTSAGASLIGPGHARAGGPGPTVLGRTPATAARVARAAATLAAAGLEVSVTDDLAALVWRKLAVNCAINPLTALHDLPNGALLADPALRAELEAAAREVGAVAAAAGVDLGADPAALAVEVARRTAANVSSMRQDVRRGAPSEIEHITGAVVAEAARRGVPVPVNARLLAAVRALEARRGAPSADAARAPLAEAV